MVIMTAKLSKGKLIAALLILLAVVIATVLVCTSEPAAPAPSGDLTAVTNEDRLSFLSGYGWSVSADPVDTQQIRIPAEASEVFDRYNQLQKSQGFDLSQYAGQTVDRYVYEILNYEAVPSASVAVRTDAGFAEGETALAAATAAENLPEETTQTPETEPQAAKTASSVYATVLVCDGIVIGGDIASADPTGIMHGFAKP